MIKKALRIILSLVMSFGLVLSSMNVTYASESDFATIKTRLKDYFLTLDTIDDGSKVETCYVSKAKDYLDLMALLGMLTTKRHQVLLMEQHGHLI